MFSVVERYDVVCLTPSVGMCKLFVVKHWRGLLIERKLAQIDCVMALNSEVI